MAVAGLTRSLSIAAGRNAAFGAGAKVMANISGWLKPADIQELEKTGIEILLLCGGYEKGNQDMILHNAELLSSCSLKIPVIYGGNSDVGPVVREMFRQGGKECFLVENVIHAVGQMNTGPAEEIIRHVFMKRIANMNSMGGVQEELGEMLIPTPAAVLTAGELLSSGTEQEAGLGSLMLVDVGGATPVEEFADTLIETGSKFLVVSTYNGMAYSFAKAMAEKLKELHLEDVKFLMGGRLNEAIEGADLPEDVSARLAEMGINVDNDAEAIVNTIRTYWDSLHM